MASDNQTTAKAVIEEVLRESGMCNGCARDADCECGALAREIADRLRDAGKLGTANAQ